MSVILVTDRYETIARVMRRLAEQTIAGEMEIVIVTASKADLNLDESVVSKFAGLIIVEGSIESMAPARAAGVRAATAPVVFLGETHSFPEAEFAAILLRAHEQPLARQDAVPILDQAAQQLELPPGQADGFAVNRDRHGIKVGDDARAAVERHG